MSNEDKRVEYQAKKHKIFGRPRAAVENKRSVKVAVFLTVAEAAEIKTKSEQLKISPTEFLRRAGLRQKIEARKSTFDAAALGELRLLGQNVNQTTRDLARARTAALPVDFQKLEAILKRQLETLQALKIVIIEPD